MADAEELLRQRAPEAVCERVDTIARECAEKGLEHLEVFLAALPRRIGRQTFAHPASHPRLHVNTETSTPTATVQSRSSITGTGS